MKKILQLLIFVFALTITSKAQQLVVYNQHLIDPFSINPAFAGMDEKGHINMCFRKQWLGFSNSPTSYYLSGYSRLGEKTPQPYDQHSLRISRPQQYESLFKTKSKSFYHAIGGYIQSDKLGPFTRLSPGLTYSPHFKISKKYTLGIGILAGLLNYTFNDEGLLLASPDDQTYLDFLAQNTSSSFMNLNAGMVLYSEKMELHYAAQQLLRNQIWFVNNASVLDLQLHHFLGFAYRFTTHQKNMVFKPSFTLRYVQDLPLSFDLSILADFEDKFWAAMSYRYNNAVVTMVGMNFNQFRFGYAFDYNSSALRKTNAGSHEIFMGMNF